MPDNLGYSPGAGATVATDEVTIGGVVVQVQRVKLVSGADGVYDGDVGGTLGLPVRQGRDPARTNVAIVFQGVAPATADTLLSLTRYANGAAGAAATSIGVTAGKILRITSIVFSLKANAAAAAFGTMTLRVNPTGATVIGSPGLLRLDVGTTAAVVGGAAYQDIQIPDGIELSGTQTLGVSLAAQATTNIVSIGLYGYEY